MIENNLESDLSLILKCIKIDFNGEMLDGHTAFKNLIICDMLGEDYIIDWDKTPCQIKTKKIFDN